VDPVKAAVIGCGYWAPNIVRNLESMEHVDLAVLCDIDERLAQGLADRLAPKAQVLTDMQAICDDPSIQAVFVVTPVRTHFSIARQLLLSGKHVYVEKPLAQTSKECGDLGELADEQNRTLMVGHLYEYHGAVEHIKRCLDEGELGQLLYLYSQRINLGRIQNDIGALWSFAPHDVSIINYWLGAEPIAASAHGMRVLGHDVEDVVFVVLEYPNGVQAHLHLSWMDPQKIRQMTLVGSQKMLVYDDVSVDAPIRIYDKGVPNLDEHLRSPEKPFQFELRSGEVATPNLTLAEPLNQELRHFINCIQTGARPRSDAVSGQRVVKVLEAAQQSIDQGGVTVPIPAS